MSGRRQESEQAATRPPRLGATEVARRLLERRAGDVVKIELATSTRGVVTIGVDVTIQTENVADAIADGGRLAEAEFDRLRAKYPWRDLADEAKGAS